MRFRWYFAIKMRENVDPPGFWTRYRLRRWLVECLCQLAQCIQSHIYLQSLPSRGVARFAELLWLKREGWYFTSSSDHTPGLLKDSNKSDPQRSITCGLVSPVDKISVSRVNFKFISIIADLSNGYLALIESSRVLEQFFGILLVRFPSHQP